MKPLLALFFSVLCTACSSLPDSKMTPDQVLNAGVFEYQPGLVDVGEAQVLALDPAMEAFLDAHIADTRNRNKQLRQLLQAIVDSESFGLVYDTTTRTAAETFAARRGNCISFTNMFVAMARHVGLDVSFQQVAIPTLWQQQGDLFILNGHINVHVNVNYATEHVVDFDIEDFKSVYEREVVDDERAYAHYYNNIAVQYLQDKQFDKAYAHFYRGLQNDATFTPLWINLGTLYKRAGYLDLAEASYLRALQMESGNLVVISNLALLETVRGNTERAENYRQRAHYHRMRNPYYRAHVARSDMLAGNFDAAVAHLKFALRKVPIEDSFHFMLAVAYQQQGLDDRAQRHFARAEELSDTSEQQLRYQRKREMLLSVR